MSDTLKDLLTFGQPRVWTRQSRKDRRPRDGQKSKLYNAERAAFTHYRNKADVSSTIKAEIWVGRVLRNERAKAAVLKVGGRWPARINVKGQARAAHAKPWIQEISLSKWALQEWVILHEMAHVMNPSTLAAGHGREYAAIYLALVGAVLGKSWADTLKREFRAKGVKFKAKRTLSAERKAALAARLAAMREQKAAIKAMSDDDYLEHNASKHDGAISIDDPRALEIVVRQQAQAATTTVDEPSPAMNGETGTIGLDLLRAGYPAHQYDIARALSES